MAATTRPPRPRITRYDRTRVAARAGCDPSTVWRYSAGKAVHSTTAARIEEACRELGIHSAEPRQ